MAAKKKKTEDRFEDLLTRLEAVVDRLENGETDLEDSLAAFEEGVGLSRQLNERLNRAEEKVELLIKKASGEMESAPFQARETGRTAGVDETGDDDDTPF